MFPLWPVYGLPMLLLRWLWIGNGNDGEIPPIVVFWTLRVLMFIISFVLEDWAIHELVGSKRHRRIAGLLVASSYVTWTYQTHTFSNSVETLVVAWCLVLIERIVAQPVRKLETSDGLLGTNMLTKMGKCSNAVHSLPRQSWVSWQCLVFSTESPSRPLS